MNKLETTFCGIKFKNPFILPSGIIAEIPEHIKAEKAGAGGITLKSITVEKRGGHPYPRIIKFPGGFLNSVGLRNPGIKNAKQQIKEFLTKAKVPIIVSLFATKISDFQKIVSEIFPLKPAFIELNLSCPNVDDEFGKPLGMGVDASFEAVKKAKKNSFNIPLIAKLTPNVANIAEVAKACEKAEADAISAINTLGPGMVIDIKKKRPVLGNKKGGVSGPAIKPIAVRCVYEIYEAVKIPIIGMGGITTWEDAVEIMMAGASLVGIGSAVYLRGYRVFEEIKKEVEVFLRKEGYYNVSELIGLAH